MSHCWQHIFAPLVKVLLFASMLIIHIWIVLLLMCSLFDFCHCTLSLSFFFFFFSFPFPDACVHAIESEPGAGSRPGVQQPNKLSAQYQARPAGKKLCVYACLCAHICVTGVIPFRPSHNYHKSACTVCILHVILSNHTLEEVMHDFQVIYLSFMYIE